MENYNLRSTSKLRSMLRTRNILKGIECAKANKQKCVDLLTA
ncbi:unnamed protein product, partial [marine sediment metagenome]